MHFVKDWIILQRLRESPADAMEPVKQLSNENLKQLQRHERRQTLGTGKIFTPANIAKKLL